MEAYYSRAVELVTVNRKASTSYIQRRLQIGFNTAAALVERMEAEGIVGPANEFGKREILRAPGFHPASMPDHVSDASNMPETAEAHMPETITEPEPEHTGPLVTFICASCDITAQGPENGLPYGWYSRESAILGTIHNCAACSARNAVKIATSNMTTEEIMSAGKDGAQVDNVTTVAQSRLRSYLERIARLREDAAAITADLKEVGQEAKGEGFDWKVLMRVAREAEKDPTKRQEEQALFDLYASAAGLDL